MNDEIKENKKMETDKVKERDIVRHRGRESE